MGYDINTRVRFKAGYKIWETPEGGSTVDSAYMDEWVEYEIMSGAIALTVGAATASVSSILF